MMSFLRKSIAGILVVVSLLFPVLTQANASVRQEASTAWTAAAATTVTTPALGSAALVGDVEEAWVICGCTTAPTSVVDSASQAYTLRTSVNDNNDGVTIYLYTKANNGSATALTVTATWAVAQAYNGIWLKDITGVTTSPYQTSVGQDQCPSGCTSAAGTGTGAISSSNITPTSAPALISSISWDDGGGAASTVAGSSTSGATGWAVAGGSGIPTTTSSSLRVTTTSAVAMTYTNATDGGTRHFLTLADSLTEASSGVVPSKGFFILN